MGETDCSLENILSHLSIDQSSHLENKNYDLLFRYHRFGDLSTNPHKGYNYSLDLYPRGRSACHATLGFDCPEYESLFIKQIQGLQKLGPNKLPKKWEILLVNAAVSLAKENNFSQVKIQKAEKNPYYVIEFSNSGLLKTYVRMIREKEEKLQKEHQQRMRVHYDLTAKKCGFRLENDIWVLDLQR